MAQNDTKWYMYHQERPEISSSDRFSVCPNLNIAMCICSPKLGDNEQNLAKFLIPSRSAPPPARTPAPSCIFLRAPSRYREKRLRSSKTWWRWGYQFGHAPGRSAHDIDQYLALFLSIVHLCPLSIFALLFFLLPVVCFVCSCVPPMCMYETCPGCHGF